MVFSRIQKSIREVWARLSRRDRHWLMGLGGFLLVTLLFSGFWQPAQQRLEKAERLYRQQWILAGEVQRARPLQGAVVSGQPLSARLGESAAAAGLELQHLEVEETLLRLTVTGNALALLGWLDLIERQGARLERLSLEKKEDGLEARVLLKEA